MPFHVALHIMSMRMKYSILSYFTSIIPHLISSCFLLTITIVNHIFHHENCKYCIKRLVITTFNGKTVAE